MLGHPLSSPDDLGLLGNGSHRHPDVTRRHEPVVYYWPADTLACIADE